MARFELPTVEQVNGLLANHDPAATQVAREGAWIRVDVSGPGVGQRMYIYRFPNRHAERYRTTAELLAEIAANIAPELRPGPDVGDVVDLAPGPKGTPTRRRAASVT